MNSLLCLGIMLVCGVAASRLIRKLRLPAVTAYLLLGIGLAALDAAFGLSLGMIKQASGLVSNFVLALIAFSLGQNFSRENFRRIGKPVLSVSLVAAVCPWILVTLAFVFLLKEDLYVALLFGAISSATAPAATVMVVREYRARGNFTESLLGVVAVDDAWCLIIFAVSLAISRAIHLHGETSFFLLKVVGKSLLGIAGSLLLGGILAYFLIFFSRYVQSQSELLVYTLGFVLLNTGIALLAHFSVLLTNMFFGMMVVNIGRSPFKFFDILRTIDSPFYVLFFVLAGANLEFSLLKALGVVGLVYLAARTIGKVGGAYVGATIARTTASIRKYMGWALLPQAGVALGTALVAKHTFPEKGDLILTTIVASTVVYELLGPVIARAALRKAGEI